MRDLNENIFHCDICTQEQYFDNKIRIARETKSSEGSKYKVLKFEWVDYDKNNLLTDDNWLKLSPIETNYLKDNLNIFCRENPSSKEILKQKDLVIGDLTQQIEDLKNVITILLRGKK